MENPLSSLLEEFAQPVDSNDYTHLCYLGNLTKWKINTSSYQDFFIGYCDLVQNSQDNDLSNLCLAERSKEEIPVSCKLNLRYHYEDMNNGNREPYSDIFLQRVCHIFQKIIEENFAISNDSIVELITVILESSHWVEENDEGKLYCMEVRFHFPYAVVNVGVQHSLIKRKAITQFRSQNIMGLLECQPVDDWDTIVSFREPNGYVPMYGSNEVPGRPKMKLSYIWGVIYEETIESDEEISSLRIEEVFNTPGNHPYFRNSLIPLSIIDEKNESEEFTENYWLPFFLSIDYWPVRLRPRSSSDRMSSPSSQESPRSFGQRRSSDANLTPLELCEKMISMIHSRIFLSEASWLDIGRALHHSSMGESSGLEIWARATEKVIREIDNKPAYMLADGTVKATCNSIYSQLSSNGITVKTLAWYAREDNLNRYSEWHKNWCMASMEKALSLEHFDVAEAFYRVFWLDFIYATSDTGKAGKWFEFKVHRWVPANEAIALRRALSDSFCKRFEAIRMELVKTNHNSDDSSLRTTNEGIIKKLNVIISKLGNETFKRSIIGAATQKFDNDKFFALLDSNSDIMGALNGVIEVVGDKVHCRRAKPEDYISMSMNVQFPHQYTWDHPRVQDVLKWMGQVFTDRDLCHYFLKYSSSTLKGRNSDKISAFFSGETGDNSKSMIVKLFESMFGPYCIKLDISNLTTKQMSASGPTPQLARAKSTRVAFVDEPDDSEPIRKGILKKLTGGDSFFARMLQENGADLQAMFKLIFICNVPPPIENPDNASKNRTKIFPFLSRWVDNPPKSEADQYAQRLFLKDGLFEKKIPGMASAFLWLLVQYYPMYAKDGLVTPTAVIETTEAYWKDHDYYGQFSMEMVQVVKTADGEQDKSAKVTLSAVYGAFSMWFKKAYQQEKCPNRTVVSNNLVARWGKMVGNCWYGIRLVDEDDDFVVSTAPLPKPSVKDLVKAGKQEVPLVINDMERKVIPEKPISPMRSNSKRDGSLKIKAAGVNPI